LQRLLDQYIWAHAEIVFDDPDKAIKTEQQEIAIVSGKLREIAEETEKEILIETPYFIPGPKGTDKVAEYTARGISVRAITNSMAATDSIPAFSGFARYRKDSVLNGLELFELKPDISKFVDDSKMLNTSGKGGVHSKVVTFDREIVFIGSLNFDPRSRYLNTEIGVLIYSEELARQVADISLEMMKPENSWQTKVDDNGSLVWEETNNGSHRTYKSDPEASGWRKFKTFIFSLLPVEKHL